MLVISVKTCEILSQFMGIVIDAETGNTVDDTGIGRNTYSAALEDAKDLKEELER